MNNIRAKQVFEMGVKKACENNGLGVIFYNELKNDEGIDLKVFDLQDLSELVKTDPRTCNLEINAYSLIFRLNHTDKAKLLNKVDDEYKMLLHDLYEALDQVEAGYQSPYFGEVEIKLQIRDFLKANISDISDKCVSELLNEENTLDALYDHIPVQDLLDRITDALEINLICVR